MQSECEQTKIDKIHIYVATEYGWKEYMMRQSGGGDMKQAKPIIICF